MNFGGVGGPTRPDLLISGGRLVTAIGERHVDIAIVGQRIASLTKPGTVTNARRVLDADGLVVLPGAIDAHVHFDEPGRTEWEGWASGSLAAAAGGVTTVLDMPIDSDPPTTDGPKLREKAALARSSSLVDFGLFGGIVAPDPGRLEGLAAAGAVGFKGFLCDSGWTDFPPIDERTLAVACAVAARSRLRLALHCEAPELLASGMPLHLARPADAEIQGVRRLLQAATSTGAAVHVVHASAADAVRTAKRDSSATVETCPHYLALDDKEAERIGPQAWCAPPIRSADNRDELFGLIDEGLIDSIGSDHSPCPPGMKDKDDPFLGISGVETAFSAVWTTGRVSLERLSELRTAAATIFGLASKGRLAPGYDADLCLVDLDATWTPSPASLHSRHRASPFAGMQLRGVVRATVVAGRIIYANGGQADEARGAFIRPTAPPRNPIHPRRLATR